RREQRHQPRLLLRLGSGPGGARQPQREVVTDPVDVVVGAVVRHLAQRQPSPLRALLGEQPPGEVGVGEDLVVVHPGAHRLDPHPRRGATSRPFRPAPPAPLSARPRELVPPCRTRSVHRTSSVRAYELAGWGRAPAAPAARAAPATPAGRPSPPPPGPENP